MNYERLKTAHIGNYRHTHAELQAVQDYLVFRINDHFSESIRISDIIRLLSYRLLKIVYASEKKNLTNDNLVNLLKNRHRIPT